MIKKQSSQYYAWCYLLLFTLWYDNVISLATAFLKRIPYIGTLSSSILNISLIIAAIVIILMCNKVENRLLLLFIAIGTLFTLLLSEKTNIIMWYTSFAIRCIAAFVVGLLYFDNGKRDLIVKIARVAVMFSVLYTLYYMYINKAIDYNSANAYLVLASAMITIYEALEKQSIANLFWGVLSIIYLSIFGSRGPLIVVAVLVLVFIITQSVPSKKLKIFIPILCAITLCVIFFDNIYALFVKFGFSTRIFDVFVKGNSIYYNDDFSNGRIEILGDCLKKVNQSPLLGHGFLCDTSLNTGVFITTYPHNLLFELWIQFGYIFGTILFIWISTVIFKQYLNKKHRRFLQPHYYLFSSLFCSSFVILLFSSSYTRMPDFFMLIGICLAINKKLKRIDTI